MLPFSPCLDDLRANRETLWLNPGWVPMERARAALPFSAADIAAASDRLKRFAPYLAARFPATAATGGLIESPLIPLPAMQTALRKEQSPLPGRLWLKADHALPVSGSVKARGGIHEVLKVAEDLALNAGLITLDSDYRILDEAPARALFSQYSLAVGSTGNLGLSIGLMGAALGLSVTVHMSSDAKAWKKAKLRAQGVTVREYDDDYGAAVAQGRAEAESDPHCHFVDDERSADLFLGYAVAAERLRDQLAAMEIPVDRDHPLFVALPCGVGGAPGGIAFGLKQVYGDAVHCLFAEPTNAPCMLLGMSSGQHEAISVQDIGLSGATCADGLAVGRPSALVGRVMEPLLSAAYTVRDETLLARVAQLNDLEGIAVEPSAAAGVDGLRWICGPAATPYRTAHELTDLRMEQATFIAWSTGGSMVPAQDHADALRKGRAVLADHAAANADADGAA